VSITQFCMLKGIIYVFNLFKIKKNTKKYCRLQVGVFKTECASEAIG